MALKESIIKGFFDYLKTRSVFRLFCDAVITASLVTWLGIVYLGVTNFDAVMAMYQKFKDAADDQINLNTAVVLNSKIDEELAILRALSDADRAYVAKFHNGKKDIAGVHFIYSSRINEVVAPGIASTLAIRQNVLLSVINDWVAKLLKRECVVLSNIPISHPFSSYLKEGGIRATIFCPIRNVKGDLVGTIGIEYVSRIPDKNEIEIEQRMLQESGNRISGMFSLRDHR